MGKRSRVASPSYKGLKPASPQASAAARGSSRKRDTKPEQLLRRALWAAGLRYRKDVGGLPGRPDIVFKGARVAVFCDGDFWHGKDWVERRKKLARGSNPQYWIAKIERNMERDRARTRELEAAGWLVMRVWESEIRDEVDELVVRIAGLVEQRRP